jgi:hypothetical protein
MYHVIMNDPIIPIKTREVLSCMAITAIIKNKKKVLSYLLSLYFIHHIVSSNITRGEIEAGHFTHIIDNNSR